MIDSLTHRKERGAQLSLIHLDETDNPASVLTNTRFGTFSSLNCLQAEDARLSYPAIHKELVIHAYTEPSFLQSLGKR